METTDIVMTTRNRIEYLKETLNYLFERTRTPFALHVIDDGSEDGETVPYLLRLFGEGRLASLTLRKERGGICANKNLSTWLAFSDPFVITADDILCPDLYPDWLTRALSIWAQHPELGELDLNHPGAYRVALDSDDSVVYCEVIGGTFGFLRRTAVGGFSLAHFRENFGYTDDVTRCGYLRSQGWKVGFLRSVYCCHIGRYSIAQEREYLNGPFVEPLDWKTLEPPVEFRV